MSESFTAQALALIDQSGARGMRGQVIEEKLDLPPGRAAALLRPHVMSGALVMCKVINPSTWRETNEYRRSVACGGTTTEFCEMRAKKPAEPRARDGEPTRAGESLIARAGEPQPQPAAASPAATSVVTLPIDKDIPIPGVMRAGRFSIVKATLAKMDVGHSTVVRSPKAAYAQAKALGITVLVRKQRDGYRVWKLK